MAERGEKDGEGAHDEGVLRDVQSESVRELCGVLARGRLDAGGLGILPTGATSRARAGGEEEPPPRGHRRRGGGAKAARGPGPGEGRALPAARRQAGARQAPGHSQDIMAGGRKVPPRSSATSPKTEAGGGTGDLTENTRRGGGAPVSGKVDIYILYDGVECIVSRMMRMDVSG